MSSAITTQLTNARCDHVTAMLWPRYISTWKPRKSVTVFHVVSTLQYHVENNVPATSSHIINASLKCIINQPAVIPVLETAYQNLPESEYRIFGISGAKKQGPQ